MKSKYFFLTLLLSLTFIVGCDKEDDTPDPANNYMMLNELESDIAGGLAFAGYNVVAGVYSFNLQLFSSGLEITQLGSISVLSGEGSVVNVNFYCGLENEMTPGLYTYNTDLEVGTFFNPTIHIDYNTNIGPGENNLFMRDGSMTITEHGDLYEVEFNFSNSIGDEVSGTYYGEIVIDEYYLP